MPIGFRNINELWASIFTETLKQMGLNCAVICPGSRSTPLTIAFAVAEGIEVIPILDERSAAFFALGRAKASGLPVAIVCTSGTAGANFYSAVVEANLSRVPLLILTADRPQELRNCHSGQTIDQLKLFGNYPNWQAELAIPSTNMEMLAYLRQTTIYAYEQTLYPVSGAVHLNIPFRDPLAPIREDNHLNTTSLQSLQSDFNSEEFFAAVTDKFKPTITHSQIPIPQKWLETKRGIIIAGVAQPQQPQKYCTAIAQLAQNLKFPVLAEGLSPVRNYASLNPYIISTYDSILRNQHFATELTPEVVIQIGEMPTSKILRQWLSENNPLRWIIEPSNHNLDALHGRVVHLRMNIEEIEGWENQGMRKQGDTYLDMWLGAEVDVRENIDTVLAEKTELFEGKAAWLLSQVLPPQTPLFIANSMPVRDVEFFWKPNNLGIQPFFNRGANGIDGTLSTALGIAHNQKSSVMLTGDLALLHDTNGFLIRNKFIGHLTIVLINNNGGGIFEMLPISEFEPPFEELFATPQDIDFALLCQTYGVKHQLITSWEELCSKLNPLPNTGIRVLEIRTSRKQSAKWRKENLIMGNW
ncbi:MAG: 2-succinyl-5-enolpyruvyl-6-hydroxy-3-cyclohexene-1-carboxylic-acid synthase [Richelia sp. RM2_1_2]|nr:2-succinyl-5-enolpyruvyl-6-hydroxy-3-cyclohexene-1-carboxylic-acid synthase [Richelia sp. SM1_7_0]NJN09453.1 2-succinyl-5-enolpyruvyl-6-hydroxy-3-cyclohexene-1-carboxylic-acid synthase [Richelia sp. RM1_1_1]NJO29396.1 2-succinyl-5-enolpyruvyl-6-hydroxy-3-cyclohexene-1-carboxylic-acid synthase [Richelia sp. SL_2_1]NJO61467.1 2-succinyl-5-enolpyruvyl-6-hydroxy-3-cyclohexene-1-carboxylic-acid synthase [Richelia sp. RM2_1_2]